MKKVMILVLIFVIISNGAMAKSYSVFSFSFRKDVLITIDLPINFNKKLPTQIVFFALPNGNTTTQTMGKKLQTGDDWHFDIQHIAAQTRFVRSKLQHENIVVVYLENTFKAWPQWKKTHADYTELIPKIIDTTISILAIKKYSIHLNGHSGGGSFIFGYLQSQQTIPNNIKRITFIDSDYGYDSSYTSKIIDWLKQSRAHLLTVFAYNDSVALYNGKPIVSATGGTWYRSKLLMKDLSASFSFQSVMADSVQHFYAHSKRINLFLKDNPERKILHTQQVELNGFIHSILLHTKFENDGYEYFKARAYGGFVE